ncbi:hypothetical protein [Kitasatospora sp. NPDC004289]
MLRTTPKRPESIAGVFPTLAPLARTAVRLHPSPGSPLPEESSVGGPLLWPAAEPWPHCGGTHLVHDVLPATSPEDVRLQRAIQAAVANRPPDERGYTPRESAAMTRISAGHPGPEGPVAMLAVAQLYLRDIAVLRPPGDANLLQVLWCPFDHPGQNMPRTELFWRAEAAVGDILAAPPWPSALQYEGYLPQPCVLAPERVTEYPLSAELDPGLRALIRTWSAVQKNGAAPGSTYDGAEEEYYDRELSVAPGWKAGGWAPWSFTDPAPRHCRACGSEMEPMLTVATTEWNENVRSWTPVEGRDSHSGGPAPSPTPTMVTIGDGYNLQIYACPLAPQHPHTASVQ